jgi:hypothetical protein
MRTIRLADSKNRDTFVSFGKAPSRDTIQFVLNDGSNSINAKILKSPLHTQYDSLLKEYETDEALVEAMITGDPEIDSNVLGIPIENGQRILIDLTHQPLYQTNAKEIIYLPDGTIKEEREITEIESNIQGEFPVKWSGKFISKLEAYNKFIFARKYQLTHNDGLSYDFLFSMAKELHEKKSLMLIGAGAKGNEPLIFQDNGKPYRAFLEGRIDGDGYLLLMHLSNLELKPII